MKKSAHSKKKLKIGKKVIGTKDRPRFSVFRSNKYIYSQIIDDTAGKTLISVSENELKNKTKTKTKNAEEVGRLIGQRAKSKKISKVVFDRNRYKYHGRVKALADGARKEGLKF